MQRNALSESPLMTTIIESGNLCHWKAGNSGIIIPLTADLRWILRHQLRRFKKRVIRKMSHSEVNPGTGTMSGSRVFDVY